MQHSPNKYSQYSRGAALLEFIVCLFPYMLVLFAAIFFWHLALGKLRLCDYARTAAWSENANHQWGKLEGHATTHAARGFSAADETAYNAQLSVDAAVEEPVFPYGIANDNFQNILARDVYVVTANEDGTINVRLSENGARLQKMGVVSGLHTGSHLPVTTDLNFTVNEEYSSLLNQALSEFLEPRVVTGGAYRYALRFGAGQNLGLEKGAVRDNWRSQSGVTVGNDMETGALVANIVEPKMRGGYNDVKISALDGCFNTGIANMNINILTDKYYAKYAEGNIE